MSYSYYIYYRIPAEATEELQKQVSAMQVLLAKETGIVGRLLSKADEPLLWMEVYENIQSRADFESVLRRLTRDTRLSELGKLEQTRKMEVFFEAK